MVEARRQTEVGGRVSHQILQCPKCHAAMRPYNRSGVQIEQCDNCRGIFLDYGELEHLSQLEANWTQQAPPPAHGPAWGAPHHGHYRRRGFGRMLFSS
jgi:Zn-finger nucleic acid-binding protein